MMQRIRKITLYFLTLVLICGIFSGCSMAAKNTFDINSLSSYHDIPGITGEEVDAIEALKATRESFSFAGSISTELFPLANGTYTGFQMEFCELLSRLFEIPFIITTHENNEWTELKNSIDGMAIDFTGEMTPTPERLQKYHMTIPVTQRGLGIITYGDAFEIETESDLNGLKLGFWEGTITAQSILDVYPNLEFEIVTITGEIDEIEMLRSGITDANVQEFVSTYAYEGIENINIIEAFPLVFTPISLTTANDELEPIISAVNKYIEAGGIYVLRELNQSGRYQYKRHMLRKIFTDEELAYIDSLDGKIPIVMGTDTYPVSFYNKMDGEFQGISMDILEEISVTIGIEFEVINNADASWGEILEMLRIGEAALISDLIITEERKEHFIWPQTPFFSTPYAFFSKAELPYLDLYQIEQSAVGVVGWCATYDLYKQWFPNSLNTKLYDSQDEALDALEKNEIDLFFNLGYILNYQKEFREKPGYKANYTFPVLNDVFFGLNKNEEMLCSIIDKSISHIDTDKILNDWSSRSYDFSRELAQSRFYLALLISALLLLVLVIVSTVYLRSVRNRRSATEVEKRTKLMLDANPLCCEIWDSNLNLIDCNEATIRFLGVNSKEEYMSGIFNFSPEFQPDGQRSDEKTLMMIKKAATEGSQIFEWQHILFDGTHVPAEITLVPVKYGNDDVIIAYTRDLREHLKMLEEIYEAEERTKLMLDASPLCCQLWHRNLKTMDCNEAAVNLYGFKDKQEYIDKFNSSCSPEYQPDGRRSDEKAEALINEAFETGYSTFEWIHQMPDGTPFPAEITLVRVSYKDDYIVAGYTRDLRSYKKMVREINRTQELMQTVNHAASIMLAAEDVTEIESALLKSMELMGLDTESDRVQIWQNETIDGVLRAVLRYNWLSETGKQEIPVPIGSVMNYADKPGLESLFRAGGIINGLASDPSLKYRELLSEHDIKTIVFIPLFVNEKFWGLFSLDNCQKERHFSENETNILQSASLMMATAIDRHSLHLELLEAHSRTKILLDATPLCCQLWNSDLKKIDCNEEAVRLFGFKDKADFLEGYSALYPELQPDGRVSADIVEWYARRAFNEGKITFDWTYQMFDGSLMPAEVTMVRVKHENGYVLASYTRDLREYNRMMVDIKHRTGLVDITNRVAFSLLSPMEETDFEKSLIDGLGMLGRYMDTDRVQIWQNEKRDGVLFYKLNNEWLSDRVKASPIPIGTTLKYSDTWRELFLRGGHINEYVSDLEPEDRELMESLGLMSTVTIPLFSSGEFWGLLCVDDCLKARKFEEEDVNMLKSAGLMIVNSLIRVEQSAQLHKANEQLTVALEQANAASKAKGDFLSAMSHEMRTPMNAIIGMTTIAKKTSDIEHKNHSLNKIGDASSHLLGVINDVLDMAKIEANKLELAPTKFNFERMLQKVLTITNFRADEKHQQLTVSVDKNIPRFLIGDDQRLAQVLANLLSNAVKFTAERGKINLNTYLNSETDGGCELRIEVTDSGIGMSPEQIEKLFSPFEQADSGINRKYGGTGLGLVISKRIVELMNGDIWVESELGHGTRFTFTVNLSYSDSIKPDKVDSMADGINFDGKKMLVAEDIEINREILISLLDDKGLIFDCAENGKEALEKIEAAPDKYDIVFMDMQMPLMDGLEATRRIRALPGHKRENLPIIAMTANVFKSDIEKCIEAGMDDHLGKPIDIDNVLEILRKYLS